MTKVYVNYLEEEILIEVQVMNKKTKRIEAYFEVFKTEEELEEYKKKHPEYNFIEA